MSVSWAYTFRICHGETQDSLRHISVEEQGQEGPHPAFHHFRIGPLPHSCPTLTRGCPEPQSPRLLPFSIRTTWLALPTPTVAKPPGPSGLRGDPGLSPSGPCGSCAHGRHPLPPSWGVGVAAPGPSTSLTQIPGGEAVKPTQAGEPSGILALPSTSWVALGHRFTSLSLSFPV